MFTKDLFFSMNDPEVKLLQEFLNNNGYEVSPSGYGSFGNETTFFGNATRAALIRFQQLNNIMPALGYFGPITRGVVNSL
jgi:peptidoglycan hydrolase-like protein with peptidoglycan-binding domain